MPRSGSTLMYNIIRQVLLRKYSGALSSGWIEEIYDLPSADVFLIKTHHLDRFKAIRANHIFYSYRDIRDALVSMSRKFKCKPSLAIAREWIDQFYFAKKCARIMIRYEDMASDISSTILSIAQCLDAQSNIDEITASLPVVDAQTEIDSPYSKVTLLHNNHVTGTISGEWRTILDETLQKQLISEFGDWFQEHQYPLS